MQQLNPNIILIGIGIILAIAEVILGAATGFELLVIGVIFVLGGLIGSYFGSFTIALITIAILCMVYIVFGRQVLKEKLHIDTKATNIDDVIGKKGTVIKKITPSKPGQIKVGGEIWRASSDKTIEEGQSATVASFSGVTLEVKEVI